MKKIDKFESILKIPDRLIFAPDVQEIENDKEYEKIIKNRFNIKKIINSIKFFLSQLGFEKRNNLLIIYSHFFNALLYIFFIKS